MRVCMVRALQTAQARIIARCANGFRGAGVETSAPGTLPERGRLKWKQTKELSEFKNKFSTWEPMFEARRAVGCEWCSRDTRHKWKRRRDHRTSHVCGRSGRSETRVAVAMRVTSAGIPQHEWRVCKTWRFPCEIARQLM